MYFWQDHPKNVNLRNEVFDDYKDLKIVIGNGYGVGKNSIEVRNVIDASMPEAGEGGDIVDLDYDADNEGFVGLEQNDSPPMRSLEVSELPKKQLPSKRSRDEYDGSSKLGENSLESDILEPLTKLTRTFERFYDFMRNRENKRTYTFWDGLMHLTFLTPKQKMMVS